ncbi:MAG: protein-glutamate O-methyltransferase CheR [Leptospiraceae bacterium]|nr:protein-glutamate O-methyltransferase CheR [Leptospiraceae bacterium]MDW7975956.1 protein-glutamate O-methyltransferase CheR [Leptospiraceae bacterium]
MQDSFFIEIPDMSEEQFQKFSKLILEVAGIHLKEHKITLLSNRIRKRLRELKIFDYDEYYQYLTKSDKSASEMIHFLEVITTNESYFWRSIQNFEAYKKIILPDLLKLYHNTKIKVWSAGCSTGEEPYNIVIESIEAMKELGFFNFEVYATDISQKVIEFAKQGCYSGRKIEKVPPHILKRYFRPHPEDPEIHCIREDLKSKVIFKVENLFHSTIMNIHVIFCRNVMIYFQKKEQQILANEFYQRLLPNGYLIIGHAESLQILETPFKVIHTDYGTIYKKEV